MSDELLALADRCEREEPSQDLREAIGWAAGYTRQMNEKGRVYWIDADGDSTGCPDFCLSIDAAVTLVPEGWRVDCLCQYPGSWWECRLVNDRDANALAVHSFQVAKTEIAARLAAALRARAATTGGTP